MSQGSVVLPVTGTLPGLTLCQDLNTAMDALLTSNAGAAAPANGQSAAPEVGQLWLYTYTGGSVLFLYNNNSVWQNITPRTDFLAQATATPNMVVNVSAGNVFGGSVLTNVAAQAVTIAAANGSHPRIDRIGLNAATGVYTYIEGTAASSPAVPVYTAGLVPCCQVYVGTGVTSINNSNITDERAQGGIENNNATINNVRTVTSGPVTCLASDGTIYVNNGSASAITINLISSPPAGQRLTVKDLGFNSGTYNLTLTPAAGNIENEATFVMNVNGMATTIEYNGASWSVIG